MIVTAPATCLCILMQLIGQCEELWLQLSQLYEDMLLLIYCLDLGGSAAIAANKLLGSCHMS